MAKKNKKLDIDKDIPGLMEVVRDDFVKIIIKHQNSNNGAWAASRLALLGLYYVGSVFDSCEEFKEFMGVISKEFLESAWEDAQELKKRVKDG